MIRLPMKIYIVLWQTIKINWEEEMELEAMISLIYLSLSIIYSQSSFHFAIIN